MISHGISSLQTLIMLVLTLAALALQVYALVDCARRVPRAFPAEGKLTKNTWLIILGVATALSVAGFGFSSFLGLIAVVAAIIYLVDVKPRVSPYSPPKGGSGPRPGSW